MSNKTWVRVKGYEDRYYISDEGDIYSIKRKKLLKRSIHGKESQYYCVTLSKDGKCTTALIHRLVAQHFIPNPENKPSVNHIDGNKLNNRVDNLEWATWSEQQRHAYELGLRVPNTHDKFKKNIKTSKHTSN